MWKRDVFACLQPGGKLETDWHMLTIILTNEDVWVCYEIRCSCVSRGRDRARITGINLTTKWDNKEVVFLEIMWHNVNEEAWWLQTDGRTLWIFCRMTQSLWKLTQPTTPSGPRAGSGVARIDPLRFLAGCRKRRLNQALSIFVLCLSMVLFVCVAASWGLFLYC